MEGTIHANNYVVYYYALSLMISKAAIYYMKHKGYWKRLVRPLQGINTNQTQFENRVISNHPYIIPLDAHLNVDLHLCMDQHVILTSVLGGKDPIILHYSKSILFEY